MVDSKNNGAIEPCKKEKCEIRMENKNMENVYSENIRFNEILEESHQLIAIISTEGILTYINKAMYEFANMPKEELLGKPYWELPWWHHSEDLQNKVIFEMEKAYHGEKTRFDATHIDHDGKIHEIDFVIKPYMDCNGEVEYFIAMGYDISDLVEAKRALTQREKQVRAFFQYSQDGYFFYPLPESVDVSDIDEEDGIYLYEYQRITRINGSLKKILGIDSQEELDIKKLLNLEDGEELSKLWYKLIKDGRINMECEYFNQKEGKIKTLSVSLVSFSDEENMYSGNFGIIRDITTQKEYEKELVFLANKDSLTGIDNRRTFFRKAIEYIAQIRDKYEESYVIMLDIDFFKSVNDTYGHDAGDEVLRRTALNIQDVVGEDYIFGRYGGEEFSAILKDISREDACAICERIRARVEGDEIEFEDRKIKVTISIGITEITKEDKNIDVPLSLADEALYEAKHAGRNRYVYKYRT